MIASRSSAVGGGFPGIAVFSYLALLVFSLLGLLMLLASLALFSVWPWTGTPLAPNVGIAPGVGVGLGDSVALAPGHRYRVAGARAAGGGRSAFAVAPVRRSGGGPVPRLLGVSRAQPVRHAPAPAAPAPAPGSPSPAAEPVAPTPAPAPPPAPTSPPVTPSAPAPHLVANFEDGLKGWSTAAVGDVTPRVVTGIVRDGSKSSVVRLSGDQSSSRLILGGDGGPSEAGTVQVREGDEYAFSFSFYVQTMVYGEPGVDNLVLRFKGDASEDESLGLQLWSYAGVPWQPPAGGLWASGGAVGGDRFLAPVAEREWHDVTVRFRASGQGAGFYEVYLGGQLVDARDGVSLIAPGSEYAQIEVGLFRDGSRVRGTSEIRIDAARLGDTLESVLD